MPFKAPMHEREARPDGPEALGAELIHDGLRASSTKEAKRSRDRRKWRMEDSFAQSANLHGFKR